MALSRRIRAFSGVVLFLSVLPAAYLIGEVRGARNAAGKANSAQTSAVKFEPIERLQPQPQQLNSVTKNPSGSAGHWNVAPTPGNSALASPSGDPFVQVDQEMKAMQARMHAMIQQMQAGFPAGLMDPFGAGLDDSLNAGKETVEEKDGAYVYHFSAPGLDQGSLKVNVEDGRLSVNGSCEENSGGALSSQSFSEMTTLPGPVDSGSLKTDFKDGVLTITINKQPSAGTRSPAATHSGSILN